MSSLGGSQQPDVLDPGSEATRSQVVNAVCDGALQLVAAGISNTGSMKISPEVALETVAAVYRKRCCVTILPG